jgi:hypothetical protein
MMTSGLSFGYVVQNIGTRGLKIIVTGLHVATEGKGLWK